MKPVSNAHAAFETDFKRRRICKSARLQELNKIFELTNGGLCIEANIRFSHVFPFYHDAL
ncbi:hypothetical protein J8TS2_04190 [Lederbergia ruris]|uniref:Uncharacterized protein n=1 Tax=Lederbergia ruris TaxID=217495 RepID=A0ABQ4KDQ9_9BACI|nr:hypothetical protein J8TS2_04190 [Lederbergia ruris]